MRLLAENRWPFRLHATYDESIAPLPRRLRGGQPRRAVRRAALVLRPRRDDHRPQPGADQGAGRRHRRAAPHGLPGRILRRPLRRRRARAHAADPAHAARWASRSAPAPTPPASPSYNPWVSLYWLVTGKTVGGSRCTRKRTASTAMEALRLYTRRAALVLRRGGQEGGDRSGPAGRPGGAVRRLLRRARGGDQGNRIGADDRRRQGRVRR